MMILAANTLGTIVATVVAFLIVTLLLVALLLFVKQKLSPSGPVKITINGEIWFAEANTDIPVGEKAIITAVDGATLKVIAKNELFDMTGTGTLINPVQDEQVEEKKSNQGRESESS